MGLRPGGRAVGDVEVAEREGAEVDVAEAEVKTGEVEAPVDDLDALIIDHQLVVFAHVVKYGHLVRADDDQPLLLVWVQPAHEDVCAHARRELHIRHRHVGDPWLQVSAAGRRYSRRPRAD